MKRRDILKAALGGLAAGLFAQTRSKLAVMDGGGANVVAFDSGDGLVLVDSGAPKRYSPAAKVVTVFNTHYHLDQTGNNEAFGADGAKIIAHARTRQWMSTDYWVPEEERYEKARAKAGWPNEGFERDGSLRARD